MTYQPKGGMCATCRNIKRDCSGLPFASMPVIKVYPDGTKAVKCKEWERKNGMATD